VPWKLYAGQDTEMTSDILARARGLLQDATMQTSSIEDKMAFLQSKGLAAEDIRQVSGSLFSDDPASTLPARRSTELPSIPPKLPPRLSETSSHSSFLRGAILGGSLASLIGYFLSVNKPSLLACLPCFTSARRIVLPRMPSW